MNLTISILRYLLKIYFTLQSVLLRRIFYCKKVNDFMQPAAITTLNAAEAVEKRYAYMNMDSRF